MFKLTENDTPDTTFSVIEKRKQKCSTNFFFYGTGILLRIGRSNLDKFCFKYDIKSHKQCMYSFVTFDTPKNGMFLIHNDTKILIRSRYQAEIFRTICPVCM